MTVPGCRRGVRSTLFYAEGHFPVCRELFSGSQRLRQAIICRARSATVLWRRPSLVLTLGVGAGRLRMGRAQGRVAQGGVTTRARRIQRMPLAATDFSLLEASGSR